MSGPQGVGVCFRYTLGFRQMASWPRTFIILNQVNWSFEAVNVSKREFYNSPIYKRSSCRTLPLLTCLCWPTRCSQRVCGPPQTAVAASQTPSHPTRGPHGRSKHIRHSSHDREGSVPSGQVQTAAGWAQHRSGWDVVVQSAHFLICSNFPSCSFFLCTSLLLSYSLLWQTTVPLF